MKINFPDKSYIEATKSDNSPGKIIITIAARDSKNPRSMIASSAELTKEEFDSIFNEFSDKDIKEE